MPFNLPQLPPDLQEKLAPHMARAKEFWEVAKVQLGPMGEEIATIVRGIIQSLERTAPGSVLGGHFRHLAVVGLNRVEVLLSGETESVQGDNWQDLVDDTLKRHTALIFFAPRGLDGQPVNPYLFLSGEGVQSDDEVGAGDSSLAMAQQITAGLSLLDFCRISPATPNTLNILVAADTLFHWDVKDNYVLPTATTTWVRDVEHVIQGYPRTTRVNIYTQWDADVFPPAERITFLKLRDLPLDDVTWLNQPTMQEKYGTHMLTLALMVAASVYGLLWVKGKDLTVIKDDVAQTEQQIPRGGDFGGLDRSIAEQEKQFDKRKLFPLLTKDAARAAQLAGLQLANIEVKVDDIQNPPKLYVVTWEAQKGLYQGFLEESPMARQVMLNSAFIEAIRKPPTGDTFKLEGVANAATVARDYANAVKQLRSSMPDAAKAAPQAKNAPAAASESKPPVLPQSTIPVGAGSAKQALAAASTGGVSAPQVQAKPAASAGAASTGRETSTQAPAPQQIQPPVEAPQAGGSKL
jgi:hypothetical protein